jgi:hypothetical protein
MSANITHIVAYELNAAEHFAAAALLDIDALAGMAFSATVNLFALDADGGRIRELALLGDTQHLWLADVERFVVDDKPARVRLSSLTHAAFGERVAGLVGGAG